MNTTIDQLYPDIWEYVFEYFNVNELFFTFENTTKAIDELLMNNNNRLLFRSLRADIFLHTLPKKLRLNQVCSLELRQVNSLSIIEQCTVLRLLKLVGESEWILSILTKVLNARINIERLILITPGVGSLHRIFESLASIFSLFRFEIYANELEEQMQMTTTIINQTNIRRFTLHSCSSISWNDLSYMLPCLSNIHFLDITLFQETQNRFTSFTFPKLRYIHLILHELSFKSILELIKTAPLLTKLKLSGLVDGDGFVCNYKWISLFNLCSSLNVVVVNLSLDENIHLFRKEIQRALHQINLNLRCLDDGYDYYVTRQERQRWWQLSGTIMRHHALSGNNNETF